MMIDAFTPYERGLEGFQQKLDKQHARLPEFLNYAHQLRTNIRQARQDGDTPSLIADRNRIVKQLNTLALETMGVSFNELCELGRDESMLTIPTERPDTPPPSSPPDELPTEESPAAIPRRTWGLLALSILDFCLVFLWGWCLFGDQPNLMAYLQTIFTIVGVFLAILTILFVVRRPIALEDVLHRLGTNRGWARIIVGLSGLSIVTTFLFWPLGWVGKCRATSTSTPTSSPTLTSVSMSTPTLVTIVTLTPTVASTPTPTRTLTPTASPTSTPTPMPSLAFKRIEFSPDRIHTRDLRFGDCNGDGYPDLAVLPAWKEGLRIYENRGGRDFKLVQRIDGVCGVSLAWGDVDGDSLPDLAIGIHLNNPNRVYRNRGDCQFELVWEERRTDNTWAVTWVDWDDDGDMDLAVGNDQAPNLVYENFEGVLSSSPVWLDEQPQDRTTSLAWADWNGDGFPDLAVGNLGGFNRLYRNIPAKSGKRNLEWVWDDPSQFTWTQDVAWGDADGDGNPDLAIANVLAGPELVYYNNGSGTNDWIASTWTSALGERTYDVEWVDANQDGHLDLSVAQGADDSGINSPPNFSRIYCGSPAGLMPEPCWSTEEEGWAAAIAWADWDLDGDQDVALGNYGDNPKNSPDGRGTVVKDWLYINVTR